MARPLHLRRRGGQKQELRKVQSEESNTHKEEESHTACSLHPILAINTPPHPPKKKQTLEGFGFLSTSYPFSLLAPEINLLLLQTSRFQFFVFFLASCFLICYKISSRISISHQFLLTRWSWVSLSTERECQIPQVKGLALQGCLPLPLPSPPHHPRPPPTPIPHPPPPPRPISRYISGG